MATSAYAKLDQPDDDSDDEEKARTSSEVRRHDRETLTAEDEAEKLLGGEGVGRSQADAESRRKKKRRRRAGNGGEGEKREVMYEMEEGGPRSSSAESLLSSSEGDMQRLGEAQARKKVGHLYRHAMQTTDSRSRAARPSAGRRCR